jgi:Plasmid replication region DNA-binding N-term
MTEVPRSYGATRRGVSLTDVSQAADALLRTGERPTIEKIRAELGGGSPNTINPLLDAWWKRLAARLDSGPAALHRLPESVAHVAEALWMQALDAGRRRAQLELHTSARVADEQKQSLDIRSHVLTLREGELDSRLRDRESTIAELNLQLRELTLLLRKEQSSRNAQTKRIAELETELLLRQKTRRSKAPTMVSPRSKRVAKQRRTAAKKPRRKLPSTKRRR